jgi:hypothetical protein
MLPEYSEWLCPELGEGFEWRPVKDVDNSPLMPFDPTTTDETRTLFKYNARWIHSSTTDMNTGRGIRMTTVSRTAACALGRTSKAATATGYTLSLLSLRD